MERLYITFIAVLTMTSLNLMGQPSNDDCSDAIEFTDFGDCVQYPSASATFDLGQGSCVSPGNQPNMWYSFTAQGPEVEINVKSLGPGSVDITLLEFNGGNCDFANATELACNTGEIEYDNLTAGEEYFALLSFDDIDDSEVLFCLENPSPPPNDVQCDAESLPLDGSCVSGTTENASPSNFTISGCNADYFESAVFYEVNISPGNSVLDIELNNIVEGALAIYEIPDCNTDPSQVLVSDCGNGPLSVSADVQSGNSYYVIVSTSDGNESDLEICAEESSPPPNDDPCDAIDLTQECPQTVTGTTVDASGNFALPPQCSQYDEQGVFYTKTISAGNNTLTVELQGIEGAITILDFNGDCNSSPNYVGDVACGNSPTAQVTVEEGETYYIYISTSESGEGEFDVCATESGPPPGCSENDDCSNAESIGSITTPEPGEDADPVCVEGCNIGSSTDLYIPECFPSSWTTVYFTFTTDADADLASISVESDEMDLVALAVMPNCSEYFNCDQGGQGSVELPPFSVDPNTTYTLLVASPSGGTGHFDVCVSTSELPPDPYCVDRDDSADTTEVELDVIATSLGSPLNGPYLPGEDVTFECEIPGYSATTTVQWLQAIIPVFGNGWDPNSFDNNGKPSISSGPNALANNASWEWYEEGDIDYNGMTDFYQLYTDVYDRLALCYGTDNSCDGEPIEENDILPGGWYAYSQGTGCANQGPNTSWGDAGDPNQSWVVTFTLTAREYEGPESCTETGYVDCSVKIFTMSDQQVGCWTGAPSDNACAGDAYKESGGVNKCCEGPEIEPIDKSICSGESVAIALSSDLDPDVSYTWTVNAPSTVSGASDGTGSFIGQTLTLEDNVTTPQEVTYSVTGNYIPSNCIGQPTEIVVTVLPEIMVNAGEPIEACAGVDIDLSATATGGDGNYSFEWSNGATGSNTTISIPEDQTDNLTFSVTVSDGSACEEGVDQVVVNVNEAIESVTAGETTFCEGEATTISVIPTSGVDPYQYNWEGPNGGMYSGDQLAATSGGTYYVTVTDDNGCTGTNEITVTENPTPELILNTMPGGVTGICPGQQIDILATTVPSNLSVNWETPSGEIQDASSITASETGKYIAHIEDAFGCMNSDSIILSPLDPPEPIIIGDTVICSSGSTILSTENPYPQYEWSGGQASSEIAATSSGVYSVTVTSADGCTGEDQVEVTLDNSAVADAGEDKVINCDTPTILLDGSNSSTDDNITYEWTGGTILSGQFDPIAEVEEAGTFILTVSNSETGCSATDEVQVTSDFEPPFVDAGDDAWITCQSPELTIGNPTNPSTNHEITWSTSDGNITGSLDAPTTTVDQAGTYIISITNLDNGCSATDEVIITSNDDIPSVNAGDDFTLDCGDNSQYTPNTSGSSMGPSFNYEWTSPDGGNIASGENSLSPVINAEGTYVLTIENTSSGCVATDTLSVLSQIENPELSGPDSYLIDCYHPDTMLYVVIDNFEGDYSFNWTTSDGNITAGGSDSLVTIDAAGTYTVEVENNENNCSSTYDIDVNEDFQSPTADAGMGQELDCASTEITLDGSGSSTGAEYEYIWTASPGNIVSGETTLNPEVDEAGTYTIKVTDTGNGCSSTDQVIIEQSDDLPTADAGSDREITCDSSQIRLIGSASGGNNLTFQWVATNGGNIVSGQNTLTPIVNSPGVYELIVTNNDNNCSASSTIEVTDMTDAPEIATSEAFTLTCDEPQLTIDASNGTASGPSIVYDWSTMNGNIIGASDEISIEVDVAATYTLTVEDESTGCTSSVSYSVSVDQEEPMVNISGMDTLTCQRSTIQLDANSSSTGAEFEGTWTASNGGVVNGDSSSYVLDVTEPGTYEFTIENTDNGCVSSSTFEVYESKNEPQIDPINDITITCDEPSQTISSSVNVIGNATYEWSSTTSNIVGSNTQSQVEVNAAGTLTLTVTDDANSCTNSINVEVVEDLTSPTVDAGESQILTCDQNTVTLDGSGSSTGSEYEYQWSTSGGNIVNGSNTLNPEVDVAATYILTVEDTENGCTATDEVIVEIDENLPQIQFEDLDSITCDNEIVEINASNSSQGSNYSYEWTTSDGNIESQNELIITVSEPGTYTLTIINEENNCEADANVTIVEDKTTPNIEIETPDKFDCQTSSLTINAAGTDTGDEFSYEWTTQNGSILSGANTLMPEVGSAGTYVFRVMNTRNGCNNTQTVVVEANDETPFADAGPDRTLTCVDSVITIDATNSSSGADFETIWSTPNGNIISGSTSLTPEINSGGTYVLTITNTFNNCISVDSLNVSVDQDYPIIDLSVSNELNCNFAEATVSATIDNAVDYSVEWFRDGQILNSLTSESIEVSESGIYTIAVENNLNDCYNTEEIEVRRDTNFIKDVFISTDNPRCFGDEKGCVIIDSINGGEAPFTLMIDGEESIFDDKVCNLDLGVHDFTLIDANGCELSLTFNIESPENHFVSLGDDIEINLGDSTSITYETDLPEDQIDSVIWEAPEFIPCSDCDSIQLIPENTTRVTITIIDENGCVYEDFMNIIVREQTRVYVPNAFTPNGDNTNDVLTVYADEKVEEVLYFEIFDRWGERLYRVENFQPNDESVGWDGTFQGEALNPGVFMYKVEVLLEDGTTIPLNGTVTLLK